MSIAHPKLVQSELTPLGYYIEFVVRTLVLISKGIEPLLQTKKQLFCDNCVSSNNRRPKLTLTHRLFRQKLLQLRQRIRIHFRLHWTELRPTHRAEFSRFVNISR